VPKFDPQVQAAILFAAKAHGDQLRKDGRTPYLVHPVGVMRLLSSRLGVTDAEMLEAALLHDVLEDTDAEEAELERAFGARVLRIVKDLTLPDDAHGPKVPTEVKTRHLVEALRRVAWDSVVVKLCDRWDNLGDAGAALWTAEKTEGFCRQSEAMLETVRERRNRQPEPPALHGPVEAALEGVQQAIGDARAELRSRVHSR
jgi:(p)ppGpp synthase/HD superfamily hydrolase